MREACVRKVHSPRVTSLSARTEGSVPEPQNTPTKSKCVAEVWFYTDENDTLDAEKEKPAHVHTGITLGDTQYTQCKRVPKLHVGFITFGQHSLGGAATKLCLTCCKQQNVLMTWRRAYRGFLYWRQK